LAGGDPSAWCRPFDADKKITADPDTWPVPFGS
jgi:hypothetical protein